jgi:NAD(P)-dependent dehydrogenase (short-subunit alcohol dehydrogenase family)
MIEEYELTELSEKTIHNVIVTGSGRGIGAAIAREFLEQGNNVVLFSRSEDELCTVANGYGRRACIVQGDITQQADRQRLVARAVETYGYIDVFISNAGIAVYSLLSEESESADEMLNTQLNTNFLSPYRLLRQILPHMPKISGRVIFISSIATKKALSGFSGYAGSKGALEAITPTLAIELAPITVNCIAPGATQTQMWSKALPAAVLQDVATKILPRMPRAQFGEPEYVAKFAAFLVDIPTMTGGVIPIDSGFSAS